MWLNYVNSTIRFMADEIQTGIGRTGGITRGIWSMSVVARETQESYTDPMY